MLAVVLALSGCIAGEVPSCVNEHPSDADCSFGLVGVTGWRSYEVTWNDTEVLAAMEGAGWVVDHLHENLTARGEDSEGHTIELWAQPRGTIMVRVHYGLESTGYGYTIQEAQAMAKGAHLPFETHFAHEMAAFEGASGWSHVEAGWAPIVGDSRGGAAASIHAGS